MKTSQPEVEVQSVDGREWALVALLAAVAFLSGVLELLLVPLYVGSWVVPISVVFGVVGNVVLPRAGFALVRTPAGALLPLLAWLIAVLAPVVITRPEGDILVAGVGAQEWVLYSMLLLGAGAGFVTFVMSSNTVPPPKTR